MDFVNSLRHFKTQWSSISYYQRFEALVAFLLTCIIGLIVLVALFRLSMGVIGGLLFGALDPLEHNAFQKVFGEIMTLLITLEFNHTLQYVVRREQSIIQTRIVILIALLALSRKLIILDLHEVSSSHLLGLAAVTLALSVAYWLVGKNSSI